MGADHKIGYQPSWLTNSRGSSSRRVLCETASRKSPDFFVHSKIHMDTGGGKKFVQTIAGHPRIREQFRVDGRSYRQSTPAMGFS